MEIVIKIPEEDMEYISTYGQCNINQIMSAISNGIVLPKGHGKLKDVDDLKEHYTKFSFSCQNWVSDVDISNAPIIIEADKKE